MVFPLVRVTTLPKDISDHNPILVESGTNFSFGKKKFRFEKWWLEIEGFENMVKETWSRDCSFSGPVDR